MRTNGSQRSDLEGSSPPVITQGVSLLIGDPKKAILKLSGPMIVAMLVIAAYNLVNAVWVVGLGSDALAAVGFIMPVFMIIFGISSGIGAGVASSISRKIGANDKAGADDVAMHALILVILLTVILTVPLYLFAEPIVKALGAGTASGLAVEYGRIIFAGAVFVIFQNIAFSILRAEGDTLRTMYVMTAASILNAVLDPILIYYAGMGISGAAWGTVISTALGCTVPMYWLMIKGDTYVSLTWKSFSLSFDVMKDILQVGLPASLEFLLLSIDALIINSMLTHVSGTDAVAVYAGGWRVIMFALIPMIAIGTAALSVAGASFGSGRYQNLQVVLSYSVRLALMIGIATSVLTWALAPQITTIFTYSPDSVHLTPTMVAFLQMMCLFYPFVPPGIMSASIFQGTGKGVTSLIIEFLRVVVFIAVMAFVLGIVFGMGEYGVWLGIILGNIMGGIVGYIWARLYIRRLEQREDLWSHLSRA